MHEMDMPVEHTKQLYPLHKRAFTLVMATPHMNHKQTHCTLKRLPSAWSKIQAKVKSIYFNHPSPGNSTNYYLILRPRDKAAPPASQQIKTFPMKRVKDLAIPSSIFIFIYSSSTGEHYSQPVRGNVRRIGRMFPEHVERSFLDPEYSFVAVRRILPARFAKQKFSQLRTS